MRGKVQLACPSINFALVEVRVFKQSINILSVENSTERDAFTGPRLIITVFKSLNVLQPNRPQSRLLCVTGAKSLICESNSIVYDANCNFGWFDLSRMLSERT